MATKAEFWSLLGSVQRHAQNGNADLVERAFQDAARSAVEISDERSEHRQRLLEKMASLHEVDLTSLELDPPQANAVERGVSIVTSCRNRNENLLRALPSWLACPEVSEVIIIDWSSTVPVADDLDRSQVTDARVRVIRVDDEPRWILSHPFNLGFAHARFDKVLKADADIVIDATFFRRNTLKPNQFIAGNWRTASEGQAHVNGFFFTWRDKLLGIGGFNEYITTYGWDDDELYARLGEAGLRRIDVSGETILHLDHDDEARTETDVGGETAPAAVTLLAQTIFLIRRNRQLANLMPTWNRDRRPVQYDILDDNPARSIVRRRDGSGEVPPASIEREAGLSAARELLAWRLGDLCYQLDHARVERLLAARVWDDILISDVVAALSLPSDMITEGQKWLFVDASGIDEGAAAAVWNDLETHVRRRGLTPIWFGTKPSGCDVATLRNHSPIPPASLITRKELERGLELKTSAFLIRLSEATSNRRRAPAASSSRQKVFADGQHGLGNRLRAIGSAAAIAQATDRELVIVWQPDDHCDCRFTDLFEYSGAVIEDAFPQEAERRGATLINYMEIEEGAEKDRAVELTSGQDIYLRSAYVFKHPASTWDTENAFLKMLKPVDSVVELINAVRWPNDLSAHIRMVGGQQFEHLPWESASNWTEGGHALVDEWRTKSHFSHFIKRIDDLVRAGEVSTMFVAADMPEVYEVFQERYGDKLAYLPRSVNDRSAEQLKFALADAALLSRSPRLLGSTWSSFSELALRLAAYPMKVEMSGKDF
jgi:hypothetical protein